MREILRNTDPCCYHLDGYRVQGKPPYDDKGIDALKELITAAQRYVANHTHDELMAESRKQQRGK